MVSANPAVRPFSERQQSIEATRLRYEEESLGRLPALKHLQSGQPNPDLMRSEMRRSNGVTKRRLFRI
jgi:hypothetical protein